MSEIAEKISRFTIVKIFNLLGFKIDINIFGKGKISMHSHSFGWISIPLWGGYYEETIDGKVKWRGPLNIRIRSHTFYHSTCVPKKAITMFITNRSDYEWYVINEFGEKEKSTDFLTRKKVKTLWVEYRKFLWIKWLRRELQ